MGLVERLRDLQGQRSQHEFARDLGISQAQLSRIYATARRGRAQIGLRVAQRIVARYPHLSPDVASFLLSPNIPHESLPSTSEILPGVDVCQDDPSARTVPGEGEE